MSSRPVVDAITLEIFRSALTAIAEEMGVVLTRSSYSPNIKERRDFSCALFDQSGRMIAQAAHMPVHLGSMPDSVSAALDSFASFAPGDVVALNDPYRGGTHLPDITLVTRFTSPWRASSVSSVSPPTGRTTRMLAASPPVRCPRRQRSIRKASSSRRSNCGRQDVNEAALALILGNLRTPHRAARRSGRPDGREPHRDTAHGQADHRWGLPVVEAHTEALIAYAERITRAAIETIPDGVYFMTDYDDGFGFVGAIGYLRDRNGGGLQPHGRFRR